MTFAQDIGGNLNNIATLVDFIPIPIFTDTVAAALGGAGTYLQTGSFKEGALNAGKRFIPLYQYYEVAKMGKGVFDNLNGELSSNDLNAIRMDSMQIINGIDEDSNFPKQMEEKFEELAKQHSDNPKMYNDKVAAYEKHMTKMLDMRIKGVQGSIGLLTFGNDAKREELKQLQEAKAAITAALEDGQTLDSVSPDLRQQYEQHLAQQNQQSGLFMG